MGLFVIIGAVLAGTSVWHYTRSYQTMIGEGGLFWKLGEILETAWFPNYYWEALHPNFHLERTKIAYPYARACVPCGFTIYPRHFEISDKDASAPINGMPRKEWEARLRSCVGCKIRNDGDVPGQTHSSYAAAIPRYMEECMTEKHKEYTYGDDYVLVPHTDRVGRVEGAWDRMAIHAAGDEFRAFNVKKQAYEALDPDLGYDQSGYQLTSQPALGAPSVQAESLFRDCTPVQGVGGVPKDYPHAVNVKKYILARLMGEGTEELVDNYLDGDGSFPEGKGPDSVWNKELFSSTDTPFASYRVTRDSERLWDGNMNYESLQVLSNNAKKNASAYYYTTSEDGATTVPFLPPRITKKEDPSDYNNGRPQVLPQMLMGFGGSSNVDLDFPFVYNTQRRSDFMPNTIWPGTNENWAMATKFEGKPMEYAAWAYYDPAFINSPDDRTPRTLRSAPEKTAREYASKWFTGAIDRGLKKKKSSL